MLNKHTFRQLIIFTAIGAIGTAGHYTVLILLVELGIMSAVPASVAGFVVGAIINYLLNYRFTFNSDKPHTEAFSKFMTVAVITACINTLLMYVGVEIIRVHYLLAQIVATGVVLLINFIANKLWTFQS